MHFTYTAKNIPKKIPSQVIAEHLLHVRELQLSKHGDYDDMLEVLRVPFDESIEREVREMTKKVYTSSLKYIFVIGIGGSSLGSRAICEALSPHNDYLPIYYLESINSKTLNEIKRIIDGIKSSDEFVVNIISKAGGTTETIANYALFEDMVSHIDGYKDRIVVTTTKESELAKVALKEKYNLLYLSKNISGRFSVFTAVGLFPLCLAGYPIGSLLDGAKSIAERIEAPHDETRRFAEDIMASINDGIHIIDFFFFNPELESLGKWGRQLYAESLGKEMSLSNREVHTGITPTVTIGTEDLHSMLQLYYAGPKDRLTLLIPPMPTENYVIHSNCFTSLIDGLSEKTVYDVNSSIYAGVNAAFDENKLMHTEMHFSGISSEMLGAFMQWNMQVVSSLAKALNIDAFNQPNIEDYKKITRRLLSNK